VYARSLAQVTSDLEAYVRDGYFQMRSVRFREPPRLSAVSTRDATAFEAGLVAANLFAAAREDAGKARAAFEELAEQNPDDLILLESRAALEMRTGRPQAAVPYLRRAVEVGSTDAETYRNLAALTAARDGAAAERLLVRSLELEPASVRARLQLAGLVGARSAAEALRVLDPVTEVAPFEAFDVFRLRATALLSLGDLDRAHAAARQLVEVARPGRRRNVASELLLKVEEQLAARDAGAAVPPP
jgi:tetratricopeptide (TPR) repeat protein